jgi:hypothetical protein
MRRKATNKSTMQAIGWDSLPIPNRDFYTIKGDVHYVRHKGKPFLLYEQTISA